MDDYVEELLCSGAILSIFLEAFGGKVHKFCRPLLWVLERGWWLMRNDEYYLSPSWDGVLDH